MAIMCGFYTYLRMAIMCGFYTYLGMVIMCGYYTYVVMVIMCGYYTYLGMWLLYLPYGPCTGLCSLRGFSLRGGIFWRHKPAVIIVGHRIDI